MKHDRTFDPRYGERVEILPGLCRLTANNPGPFTFHGTNTYILGQKNLVVVDPGPADPAHVDTILSVIEGARVEAILITHTHVDHSPAARLLQERTGAPIIGCAPHRAARALMEGEVNPLDASGDKDYTPDQETVDGETFEVAGITFHAIATPGHTANHLCFALEGEDILISGDHVMAWSTSIVAAPDGSMRDYMASIDKMLARFETTYLPGHGGIVRDAPAYVEQLKQHRLNRERSILSELGDKSRSIPEIVAKLYADVDPKLHGAAGLSVFAHLEDLTERGRTAADPGLALDASFRLLD
ncbi:MBL fold metallo-hydrolase [Labrenzia sp. PHM005]|uniref:MBL fold metallo-hydrolase n=1 Tax=Labrenzia sp. PHM005 TaxID=2590016 RepID=UPI0011404A88|nr:MBL fold metallo-hydrolase [Labrenzia sp. PHM005]QDG78959.1 MBL fold metallo-hydrolase [Labrenzia sp. PHM005]